MSDPEWRHNRRRVASTPCLRFIGLALATVVAGVAPGAAAEKIDVVATTSDVAAIAREVGGERVAVASFAVGKQDPHFVDPKPSFIVKLNRAALYLNAA